jgi:hypothetical protein
MTYHTVGVESDRNPDRNKAKHWAECKTCSWLGPLRTNWDDAQKDQDSHIVESGTHPLHRQVTK